MKARLPAMRDVWPHPHGKAEHTHAWSTTDHDHVLRQVCTRPECEGSVTHNIHPAPTSFDADHAQRAG